MSWHPDRVLGRDRMRDERSAENVFFWDRGWDHMRENVFLVRVRGIAFEGDHGEHREKLGIQAGTEQGSKQGPSRDPSKNHSGNLKIS